MLARTCALTTIAAALFATTAQATPLSNTQILNQFNEVVLGSATSNTDTDGRAWIGGSVAGGTYDGHNQAPTSSYAGLTVGGSAASVMVNGGGAVIGGSLAGSTINTGTSVVHGAATGTNFNGAAYVAGGVASDNFNGGRTTSLNATQAANDAAAQSTNFGAQLGSLSTSLSKLASTGSTVTVDKNGLATFNAVVNKNGVAVFDLTGIDTTLFSTAKEFTFNLGGATTVIMNSDDKSASIGVNFIGGGAQAVAGKVIWNFYDATSLNINSQFGGSVLATKASLTNTQDIEGDVFVNSLTQKGEIHLDPFTGNIAAVPEPETYAMLLAGLGLVGFMARRRKAASRA